MRYNEFITIVQDRGHIATFEQAERTARIVLEVLGERLSEGETIDVAEQLPHELRSALLQSTDVSSFGKDEFIKRVSEREYVGLIEAEEHVRAVLSIIPTAISTEEFYDMLSQLPQDIRELFSLRAKADFAGLGM
ncbi:MAG: DUF2267 domain-containing protein [Nitrospirota bacterium]